MKKPNKLKLGLGTGRCGTVSLSKLIDAEHEQLPMLPWLRNRDIFEMHLRALYANEVERSVALFYLKHIPWIFEEVDDVRAVCLKRDREGTIESFLKKVNNHNHWQPQGNKNNWTKCFPTYEEVDSKAKAIGLYWDDYYDLAQKYSAKYGERFEIVEMSALNSEDGQEKIFNILNIPFEGYEKAHYNASRA